MNEHLPKIEGETPTYRPWPSWASGPNGEREVFNSEAEVPAGWTHHGETKRAKSVPAAPVKAPEAPATNTPPAAPAAPSADAAKVDAAGTPFDILRHTGTLTRAGLWRMKVGVSRPENESKPLDL